MGEWVTRGVCGEVVEGEGLVGGLDVELEESVGAEPEGLEAAVGSAVGEEAVVVADDFLAIYELAVAFLTDLS